MEQKFGSIRLTQQHRVIWPRPQRRSIFPLAERHRLPLIAQTASKRAVLTGQAATLLWSLTILSPTPRQKTEISTLAIRRHSRISFRCLVGGWLPQAQWPTFFSPENCWP